MSLLLSLQENDTVMSQMFIGFMGLISNIDCLSFLFIM